MDLLCEENIADEVHLGDREKLVGEEIQLGGALANALWIVDGRSMEKAIASCASCGVADGPFPETSLSAWKRD